MSPSEGKIVFQSGRDGNNEIYLMSADGSNQTRLTNNPAADTQPALSPDGARIAFTTARDGNNEIYVMKADGTGLTRLTNDPASDAGVVFGPDGRIAFHSDRDGNNEIYLMNANGTGVTRLTNNLADDQRPAYSPDGTRVVFSSERSGNREVSVTNTNGSSGVRNLTNNPAVDDWARWSPIPGTATTTTLSVTQTPRPSVVGGGGYALPIAYVAPFNAAGTVQFKDGTTNLGAPVPMAGGVAVGSFVTLPPGPHSLTATFIPANLAAFQLSTSNTVTFTF